MESQNYHEYPKADPPRPRGNRYVVTVGISIDPELLEKAKARAAALRRGFSNYATWVIAEELERADAERQGGGGYAKT